MSSKSSVSGISGSARVQRLSAVSFSAAEAHGKRLDTIGKARAVIENAPPITTTGLDLSDLYDAHAKGAKIQKSATKALHLILQFPKDLVDGEDGQVMLDHARAFVTSIFGPEAIFADRVDRDEKSRHVVDLFLAPRYEKVTKRRSQTAITTSKHLKDLAAERGKAPNLRGQGQALQDAWFEYLRDQMQLNVARGEPKQQPGDDWQTPEQLELERLREERAALEQAKKTAREALQSAAARLQEAERQSRALEASLAPLRAAVSAMDTFQKQQDAYEACDHSAAQDVFRVTDTQTHDGRWITSGHYAEPSVSVRAENCVTGNESSWSFPNDGEQSSGTRLHKAFQAARKAGADFWVRVTGWKGTSHPDQPKPTGLTIIESPPESPKKPTIAREVLRLLSRLDDRTVAAVRDLDVEERQIQPQIRVKW